MDKDTTDKDSKRTSNKWLYILLAIIAIFFLLSYDRKTNSFKIDNVSSWIMPHQSDKKEIKEAIETAYLQLAGGIDENNLGKPFYNPSMGTSFTLLFSSVFLQGATVSAENIEVTNFTNDETADVKYDFFMKSSDNEKRIPITMVVKKVGGAWKLDSEKFIPKQEEQQEEQKEESTYRPKGISVGNNEENKPVGKISGKVGYPSDDLLPDDINVYAYNINTIGTIKHIALNQQTGEYEINVPDGEYYIFAGRSNDINDKSNGFYDQFVLCGLSINCTDHELIKVTIKDGNRVKDINTGDWFMGQN